MLIKPILFWLEPSYIIRLQLLLVWPKALMLDSPKSLPTFWLVSSCQGIYLLTSSIQSLYPNRQSLISAIMVSSLSCRGRQVLKSASLMNLINLEHSSNQVESLPPEAKRGLTKALVLFGSACEDQVLLQWLHLQRFVRSNTEVRMGRIFTGLNLNDDVT